jgi:hypothetical protein
MVHAQPCPFMSRIHYPAVGGTLFLCTPQNRLPMTRTLSLTLAFLVSLFFLAPAAHAQLPADLTKSFSKLTKHSDKLMKKVSPWMDQVKKNENLIPAGVKGDYDKFNKAYGDFNGLYNKAKLDPASLTSDAINGMSGDLGKLSSQFSGLQKQFKGLPFMK